MIKKLHTSSIGMALIEIVIGAAIISSGIIAVGYTYSTFVSYAFANERNVEASYILEEGIEVMTFFRDKGWTAYITPLSTAQVYYLNWNGSTWATTTSPVYVDGAFLRHITIANVYRDGTDKIAPSGTIDPNTKLITVSVSYYQGHGTTTKNLATYLSNIYGN